MVLKSSCSSPQLKKHQVDVDRSPFSNSCTWLTRVPHAMTPVCACDCDYRNLTLFGADARSRAITQWCIDDMWQHSTYSQTRAQVFPETDPFMTGEDSLRTSRCEHAKRPVKCCDTSTGRTTCLLPTPCHSSRFNCTCMAALRGKGAGPAEVPLSRTALWCGGW